VSAPTASLGRVLLAQTWAELRVRWRLTAFSVTSLALPVVFFAFFGLPFAARPGPRGLAAGVFLLISFGAYAVGQVMVFGFGIGVAVERGQKVDLLMRATPLSPSVFLMAKVIVGVLFGLLSVLVLFAFGVAAGGIRLDPGLAAGVVARLLVGSLPLIALGFAIGYLAGPNAAPAVANLVYLPLVFASGIFLPLDQLPLAVQRVAPYLPTYHYVQLAWDAVGASREPVGRSVAWLAGYSVVFAWLAVRAYRQETERKFA
jgi:ABC-2 type transport system permease protein